MSDQPKPIPPEELAKIESNLKFASRKGLDGCWTEVSQRELAQWAEQNGPLLLREVRRQAEEISERLAEIRRHGFGLNSPDLADAIRQVLQVAITESSNSQAWAEKYALLEKHLDELPGKIIEEMEKSNAYLASRSQIRSLISRAAAQPPVATPLSEFLSRHSLIPGYTPFPGTQPPTVCPDCEHPIAEHGKRGCEVERGDGYIGSSEVLQALGPCRCTSVTAQQGEGKVQP